jgi:MoaA/NifB/PqqE/SkfB family radical SAM enzyme
MSGQERLGPLNLLVRATGTFVGSVLGGRPVQAIYYLTYQCQSRCVYCDIRRQGGAMAETAEVVRNIEAIRDLGVRFISFTGGEPLLHPDLPALLASAKQNGLRTTLITNGLLYARRAHELTGLIDDLEFSLSTVSREAYRKERGIDALPEVVRGLELAVSRGEPVSILATVSDGQISELPALTEFARSLGVMCILGPVYGYFGNDPFPPQEAHRLSGACRCPGVWMNQAFLAFLRGGGNRTGAPSCGALRTTLAISPEGDLLAPCYHHLLESMPIRGRLRELLHSRRVQELRKDVGRWPFCEGCHIFCYFEGAFLKPFHRLFLLDAWSRIRWLLIQRRLERGRRTRSS